MASSVEPPITFPETILPVVASVIRIWYPAFGASAPLASMPTQLSARMLSWVGPGELSISSPSSGKLWTLNPRTSDPTDKTSSPLVVNALTEPSSSMTGSPA